MKDKSNFKAFLPISIFIFVILVLMLIDDGFFGTDIKTILGYFIVIFSVLITLIMIICSVYVKIKNYINDKKIEKMRRK